MEIEFTTNQIIFIAVFLFINFSAFLYVGADKYRAIRSYRRIPEAHLLFLAICFCALGVLLGILLLRHKTRKIYFLIGIPLALVENVSFLYLIYLNSFFQGLI